jgi:hypothetical protein
MAWLQQLLPSTLFGMFRTGTIKTSVLLCCIVASTDFAVGRVHDHVFDVTGTIDASDGTPVNDVEVILEVDKPIYDGVTAVNSQRLVTSKGAFIFRCLSHSPVSNYRITVRKDGFEPQTLSGRVPPDAHLTIHIKKIGS